MYVDNALMRQLEDTSNSHYHVSTSNKWDLRKRKEMIEWDQNREKNGRNERQRYKKNKGEMGKGEWLVIVTEIK